jgi:hypothetical protein
MLGVYLIWGSPSFLRPELQTDLFLPLEDAKIKIEEWRKDYNGVKLHNALEYRTPVELASLAYIPDSLSDLPPGNWTFEMS